MRPAMSVARRGSRHTPLAMSARIDYGMRALVELAKGYGTGPIKGSTLADAYDIPCRFLELILADLRRGGLVESRRGSAGGYWLARPPRTISVGDALEVLDGPVITLPSETDPAPHELLWSLSLAHQRARLREITLGDLVVMEPSELWERLEGTRP